MGNIAFVVFSVIRCFLRHKRLLEGVTEHRKLQAFEHNGQQNARSDQQHQHNRSPDPAADCFKKRF